jgi:hypothetical protein
MIWLTILLVGASRGADQAIVGSGSNALTSVSPITNYHRVAAQLNSIIAETASPKAIENALRAELRDQRLNNMREPAWAEIRADTANKVLTNLYFLEKGLRQTSIVTNIVVKPPNFKSSVDFQSTPEDVIKDPDDREQMKAYRAALAAYAKLWNLHQALQAEYSRHSNDAINFLVDLYSKAPAADQEVRQLLMAHTNYDFSLEFSNRLYKRRK